MAEARGAPSGRIGLGVVLAATTLTLAVGYLVKAPCASGEWDDLRQYRRLCYTDVVPLYAGRGVDRGLVPYLETDNEYPVLTGFAMALAGVPAGSSTSFFAWTALLLAACALATAWAVHRMAGRRALFFALAPTLAVYAFINWDLVAVALATLGTLAFLRGRDGPAGVLLGLGAAAKLYPALLLVPLAADRLKERRAGGAARMTGAAAVTWLSVNLPFAFLTPGRWSHFFRFNAERPADWDSLWLWPQIELGWPTGAVNLLAAASFLALAGLVWRAAARRRPGFPAWTLGFPLLVCFLLTSKVYSPQYSLWLLPWFALALPDLRLFAAFEAADVAVFVTRFTWFGNLAEQPLPSVPFRLALLARGVILAACLVAWVRRRAGEREGAPEPAAVAA